MSGDTARTQSCPQIELRCRVDCSMLGLLREFVCCVSRHLGFSEKQVAEIEISVDEACANAMEHAYPSRDSCPIPDPECVADVLVEIAYDGESMTVRIVDHGAGSGSIAQSASGNIDDYLNPARDNYRGLGFLLMQKFMDQVDVVSIPGNGTTIQMTKYRTRK